MRGSEGDDRQRGFRMKPRPKITVGQAGTHILITEKLFLYFDLKHLWGPWKTCLSGGLLGKGSNIAATLADTFETAPSCLFL